MIFSQYYDLNKASTKFFNAALLLRRALLALRKYDVRVQVVYKPEQQFTLR